MSSGPTSPTLGSSPRPWGTLADGHDLPAVGRFIPTPVGNTSQYAKRKTPCTVHPHARGEHLHTPSSSPSASGSSPRPWGTRIHAREQRLLPRFIPTPVGNTTEERATIRANTVHPHARGEHWISLNISGTNYGSSPRPWGTLEQRRRWGVGCRFIPTPVGNTKQTLPEPFRNPVHPHARGEHIEPLRLFHSISGSSPRPWGTLSLQADGLRPPRFIPTPVGNTSRAPPAPDRPAVHPHARGEHTRRRAASSARRPVHPHARGEHSRSRRSRGQQPGSSPRPWGTRTVPQGRTRISSVHPHARGEHGTGNWLHWGCAGSSPRPWGTHLVGSHAVGRERFIPTPVGNTSSSRTSRSRSAVHPHARGEHRCAHARAPW